MTTIQSSILKYLDSVKLSRSKNTFDTYKFALQSFVMVLADNLIDSETVDIVELSEDSIAWFALWLKDHSPATEQLYLQSTMGFFEYLAAERLSNPNLPRIKLLIRQRSRKTGTRLPQFPREDIEKILDCVDQVFSTTNDNLQTESKVSFKRLRQLRDRAFLYTLADTGLRVHEACKLRRGDIDWNEDRAIVIGKGNKQSIVRFSNRALMKIKDYLTMRITLDGSSGKPLGTLPVFSRHDKGSGNSLKAISTMTGRNIVSEWVKVAVGEVEIGKITPHSFRHYFVTTVLRGSGNLKLAQELARHANIAVTQRYAHLSDDELDKGYYELFDKN